MCLDSPPDQHTWTTASKTCKHVSVLFQSETNTRTVHKLTKIDNLQCGKASLQSKCFRVVLCIFRSLAARNLQTCHCGLTKAFFGAPKQRFLFNQDVYTFFYNCQYQVLSFIQMRALSSIMETRFTFLQLCRRFRLVVANGFSYTRS